MSDPTALLERRARALAESREGSSTDGEGEVADLRRVIHELHVHQIELELQAEELHRTQAHLESSRAALAASEREYRDLFERAPVGFVRIEQSGAIIEANHTLAEMLGSRKERLATRKLTEFILPNDQDTYYHFWRAVLRRDEVNPIEIEMRGSAGDVIEIEMRAGLSDAEPIEVRAALFDVTARMRAQAERRESERQRRLLADALPVAVAFVGSDGRLEFCNRAFCEMQKTQPSEVEGRAIFDILGAPIYAAWRDYIRAALQGRPARFEGRVDFAGTGDRHVSALFSPDPPPHEQASGFYLLIDDRTSLEDARRALRQAAAEAALAEERERRSLAVDLHDDVGQLLSLAGMKLRALEDRLVDVQSVEAVQDVEGLIRDVRTSISSLSFELSPSLLYDVGLVAAIEWLVEHLRDRFGLETEVERLGEVPDLEEATAVTVFRALRELLINVSKHAGTNRAIVTVEGREGELVLTVLDHGCGFDPDEDTHGFGLKSIFERIEALGGRIEVEAGLNRGARLSITMPAREGAAS